MASDIDAKTKGRHIVEDIRVPIWMESAAFW